jgi:hypothetical protein
MVHPSLRYTIVHHKSSAWQIKGNLNSHGLLQGKPSAGKQIRAAVLNLFDCDEMQCTLPWVTVGAQNTFNSSVLGCAIQNMCA